MFSPYYSKTITYDSGLSHCHLVILTNVCLKQRCFTASSKFLYLSPWLKLQFIIWLKNLKIWLTHSRYKDKQQRTKTSSSHKVWLCIYTHKLFVWMLTFLYKVLIIINGKCKTLVHILNGKYKIKTSSIDFVCVMEIIFSVFKLILALQPNGLIYLANFYNFRESRGLRRLLEFQIKDLSLVHKYKRMFCTI